MPRRLVAGIARRMFLLSLSRLSGLNRGPTVYKTVALPTELRRLKENNSPTLLYFVRIVTVLIQNSETIPRIVSALQLS